VKELCVKKRRIYDITNVLQGINYIQKKLKIGKKPKANSLHINVIKPKPIKNLINYQNYAPINVNQINGINKVFPEVENEFKKDNISQENSLGQLTKNFINYIKTTGKKSININDLVNELSVKKRRIYDITNVLQGIGFLQKSGKNEIIWTKTINNKSKSKKKSSNSKKVNQSNKQKSNVEILEQEKFKLDTEINSFKDEFNSIAKKEEFPKYGYVTKNDLKELSINDNLNLVLIKASKGTAMSILNKNDIKMANDKAKRMIENGEMNNKDSLINILKKSNQLSFNCPDNSGLTIYKIRNGEITEIRENVNNSGIYNNKNISLTKLINNNFNINKLDESKNYNSEINYNANYDRDNLNSNINNNFVNLNNNKEELNYQKISNYNYQKNYLNFNEWGNNQTMPHNVTVNNEQKNIAVYATPSSSTFTQSHISNSQLGNNFNYLNIKNTQAKPNSFNNKNNYNLVPERLRFSPPK
jgi:hypothetical protein